MEIPNTILIILGIVVLLIVLGVAAMIWTRRQRTERLQQQFGPEYDHTLDKVGDETRAERELEERIAHAKALNIRSLSAEEADQYGLEWQRIQGVFVDEPLGALQKADDLIREVMKEKGYPVEDFDERAALLSVHYPELMKDYRFLHRVATKEIKNDVNTEDMRQAMVHAKALFENLMRSEPTDENVNQKERI
jgi:Xaa-Pro aminopeptidase